MEISPPHKAGSDCKGNEYLRVGRVLPRVFQSVGLLFDIFSVF